MTQSEHCDLKFNKISSLNCMKSFDQTIILGLVTLFDSHMLFEPEVMFFASPVSLQTHLLCLALANNHKEFNQELISDLSLVWALPKVTLMVHRCYLREMEHHTYLVGMHKWGSNHDLSLMKRECLKKAKRDYSVNSLLFPVMELTKQIQYLTFLLCRAHQITLPAYSNRIATGYQHNKS